MNRLIKRLLVLVALVVAVNVAAAPMAEAQTWTPPGTAVSGSASNPLWKRAAIAITCAAATVAAVAPSIPTKVLGFAIIYFVPCKIGLLSATITCSGTMSATAGTATSATWNFDSGFNCTADVTGVCAITWSGPQTTGNVVTLNEATTVITVTLTAQSTATGAGSCGPSGSTASTLTASFNVTPSNLTIT